MIVPERVRLRIVTKADRHPGGCLISRYSLGSHGYAQVGWSEGGVRTVTTAHRALWIATHGDPGDLTVDHTCHVPRCVELAHLRLLPNEINAADNGQAAFRTAVEDGVLCGLGHPTVVGSTGRRHCRTCVAAGKRRRRAAKIAA